MKAYLYAQTICPKCAKDHTFAIMETLLMEDGRQLLICVNPACELFHVPFEAPSVKIKPVDDMTSDDIGLYLEEHRRQKASG